MSPVSKEEAIALTRGPYADVVEKTIAASIAPFLWRERDAEGGLKTRIGTVFFVSADFTFAVTADHVFAEYLKARQTFGNAARCQLGNLRIDPEERLVARSASLDITTFAITPEEIRRTAEGRFAMSFNPMVDSAQPSLLAPWWRDDQLQRQLRDILRDAGRFHQCRWNVEGACRMTGVAQNFSRSGSANSSNHLRS